MRRILLIEDDDAIVCGLSGLLKEEGFLTETAFSLKEAWGTDVRKYDLILLDLGLPDGEGLTFLRELAARKHDAPPVIILTARDGEADIMQGLDAGADDYVTKPFRAGVLLSRIRAVLRRQERRGREERILSCGGIRLDPEKTLVTTEGREVRLTAGEFRLLTYFMENRGRTLTRNMLLSYRWDNDGEFVNDNTLTVTVRRLREKLGKEAGGMIKTVRGIGYRMEVRDE